MSENVAPIEEPSSTVVISEEQEVPSEEQEVPSEEQEVS